jgi:predicted PurR-regulated permease PerM
MANEPVDVAAKPGEGSVPEIPQVTVDRSSAEELELQRMQRTQTTCLFILAVATGLGLAYIAKLVLVVLLSSVLLAFVLAPVVDFGVRMRLPRALSAFCALLLLLGIVYALSFVS